MRIVQDVADRSLEPLGVGLGDAIDDGRPSDDAAILQVGVGHAKSGHHLQDVIQERVGGLRCVNQDRTTD